MVLEARSGRNTETAKMTFTFSHKQHDSQHVLNLVREQYIFPPKFILQPAYTRLQWQQELLGYF